MSVFYGSVHILCTVFFAFKHGFASDDVQEIIPNAPRKHSRAFGAITV